MGAKATRVAFGEALVRLGSENPDIVVLDADLSKSTMTEYFARKYPGRFFDLGIAEGNMVGTGAGMALAGKIPFICSFACFVIGRFEQIRMSIAYSRANVKIVGTHAGIGIGEDGYSQMALEDIALMRSLPNMAVIQPADAVETERALEYIVTHQGPVFFRLMRQKTDDINPPDYQFRFGKGVILRRGKDVSLMATGGVVANTLKAADILGQKGVAAQVVNVPTIKPVDRELIAEAAFSHGKIITVEDHGITGGLGSAVSEVLSELGRGRIKRVAVEDFAESGDAEGLYRKYGLSEDNIARKALELLQD
ncbi:MAG: transketolase [Deltaproteobacteria bacterium RIFCSPLOWO2_02_FULL_57_26]|nr:MAG: transketolase [Deltaproteobacteria bacterium RIFCSPLOWO2_02_FULL_57_26]OGQ74671.1 MAG: transketolase [Deltaproteobacteria bacterium RIFCSPLOWO2_12_FULL_57_22]